MWCAQRSASPKQIFAQTFYPRSRVPTARAHKTEIVRLHLVSYIVYEIQWKSLSNMCFSLACSTDIFVYRKDNRFSSFRWTQNRGKNVNVNKLWYCDASYRTVWHSEKYLYEVWHLAHLPQMTQLMLYLYEVKYAYDGN